LRDRLYELLEHDHLPYSVGSRFVRLIVCIIVIDVMAMILASVPEFDARFGEVFTVIKIGAVAAFGLEYAARLWSVAGHSPRKLSPSRDRIEYALKDGASLRTACVLLNDRGIGSPGGGRWRCGRRM